MLTLAFSFALSCAGTVVSVPSLEEMAVASEVIADVTVVDQHVVKEEGRVLTYTTLEVGAAVKGTKKGDRLRLFQLGGDLDGRSAWIVGAHKFSAGERVIFFGMRHPTKGGDVVIPYGIGFGLFRVIPSDGRAGEEVVEAVGDVVDVKGGVPQVRRYDSVAAFEALVRRALQAPVTPSMPTAKKLAPALPNDAGGR